jgi:hypothetical protein
MTNPTEQTADLCWIVRRHGESDEAANERHYLGEQEARDEATVLAEGGETGLTIEQLDSPCLTLRCQGCDYLLDEDDEGVIHFESIEQAHEYAVGFLGEEVVFAGALLARCGADCTGADGGAS